MAKVENNCFALIEELITKIKISKILELVEPAFSNLLTALRMLTTECNFTSHLKPYYSFILPLFPCYHFDLLKLD